MDTKLYWCVCWRLGNANLESVLGNLECLCSVTESDGKVGSSQNGKTLSTYRRFIRNTWPSRNVVNICDACDQCKSLACKHQVNHLTAKVPQPKLQMFDNRTLCVIIHHLLMGCQWTLTVHFCCSADYFSRRARRTMNNSQKERYFPKCFPRLNDAGT